MTCSAYFPAFDASAIQYLRSCGAQSAPAAAVAPRAHAAEPSITYKGRVFHANMLEFLGERGQLNKVLVASLPAPHSEHVASRSLENRQCACFVPADSFSAPEHPRAAHVPAFDDSAIRYLASRASPLTAECSTPADRNNLDDAPPTESQGRVWHASMIGYFKLVSAACNTSAQSAAPEGVLAATATDLRPGKGSIERAPSAESVDALLTAY